MLFEWDPKKAETNLKKHGISFDLAVTVFDDPLHLSIHDSASSGEQRWITVGMSANHTTLIVVHVYRRILREQEILRIISARKATKKERRDYEEGI